MKFRTQLMFVEELEKMLSEMPLSKVRVSHLCKRCNTIPSTFYYYFHDKYELVAWTYMYDWSNAFSPRYSFQELQGFNDFIKNLENRKTFYQKTFEDQSQNSIEKYIYSLNEQIAINANIQMTGSSLSTEEIIYMKYHLAGIMGLFKEWLYGTLNVSTESLAQFYAEHIPSFHQKALDNYHFSPEVISQNTGKTRKKNC